MAKIKHWQGYGSLEVKKVCSFPFGYQKQKCVLQVYGDHEYGVFLNDKDRLYDWLAKRFFSDCPDSKHITQVESVPNDAFGSDGKWHEGAIYEITYWTA